MTDIKPGMFVVAWHPLMMKPYVSKSPLKVTAIGKRIKAKSPTERVVLLKAEEILAAFDDEIEAAALAETLSEIGKQYVDEERTRLTDAIAKIRATAHNRGVKA